MMHPLSIYIHWPFCKSKCPYCDFNSHVRDRVEHARWREALLKELASYAELLPDRQVVSIFFGGGTPSLMEAETASALIDAVSRHWHVANSIEVTLEANPTSVEAEKLKAFRDAGVNRVSLGVQAMNLQDLKFLGREHSADEALAAVSLARDLFPRMSFDLIYARPGQTLASWERELTQALAYTKGHMSLYQLTIEENTAFHAAYKRGELPTLDDDAAADMYALTQSLMEAHGMPAYEISNHAAPGEESLHNLAYWRGDDYIGIGPGAHGRRREGKAWSATEKLKSPERWLENMETRGSALQATTTVSAEERRREMVMTGLRLKEGIHFQEWQQRTGLDLRRAINPAALNMLANEGFLSGDSEHIRVTLKGALMLNSLVARLLA